MIRESGTYAVRDGVTFAVAYRDRGWVAYRKFEGSPATDGLVRVADLERLERVTTVATWRDLPVVVDRLRPSRLVWVRIQDAALASDLRLYGDARAGWTATARLDDLDDVREEVVDLLGR